MSNISVKRLSLSQYLRTPNRSGWQFLIILVLVTFFLLPTATYENRLPMYVIYVVGMWGFLMAKHNNPQPNEEDDEPAVPVVATRLKNPFRPDSDRDYGWTSDFSTPLDWLADTRNSDAPLS